MLGGQVRDIPGSFYQPAVFVIICHFALSLSLSLAQWNNSLKSFTDFFLLELSLIFSPSFQVRFIPLSMNDYDLYACMMY